MENLRPNKQRAKIAILLIGIVMLLDIVSLISSYFQYNLLNDIAKGVNVSIATADASDLRESIIAVIYAIAFLISGITFIQWFRRAYFNLHLRVDNLKFGEGWAAGSWFTPIISIYRPFQIMKELYEKTNELLLSREGEEGSKTNYSNFTLAIWWTLWLIDNYFGQIIFRASLNDKTNQLNITSIMSMIESLIGVILGLITIKIIRDYSMMEEKLAHQDHYYSN
jgi:hypothetical protein